MLSLPDSTRKGSKQASMCTLSKEHHRWQLQLEEAERLTLQEAVRHHPRPAVRERCAALLQVAQGASPHDVARHGLLVERDPDSVYSWMHRYVQEGLMGLFLHQQGGNQRRKKQAVLLQRLRDSVHGPPPASTETAPAPSRWTLGLLRDHIEGLAKWSLGGICQLLHRAGLAWRKGRVQYYSPDPAYQHKLAELLEALRLVAQSPQTQVALFLDEFSYTAWPDVAFVWDEPAPASLPQADRQQSPYRRMRVVGALEAWWGKVHVHQEAHISGSVFAAFVRRLDQEYPQAERIHLIWDNWPVHSAHEVQAVLAQLPRVHVVALPTYAPWLNPIEKLWRRFRQNFSAMHQMASDWKQLRTQAQAFFEQFAAGSLDLLHSVGLRGEGKLATALRPV